MKKIVIILSFIVFISNNIWAQHLSQNTLYTFNKVAINPAAVGADNSLSAIVNHREQWLNFEGNPQSSFFNIYAPVLNNLSGGLSVLRDNIGAKSNVALMLDIAYKVKLSNKTFLSFGLKPGINLYQLNYSGISNNNTDPLALDKTSLTKFNATLGMLLYSDDYYVGVSALSFANSFIEKENLTNISEELRITFNAAYLYKLNSEIELKPSVFLESDLTKTHNLDLGLHAIYKKDYSLGLNYRNENFIGVNLKSKVADRFYVGYAYNHSINNIAKYNSGTHEFMIAYKLSFNKSSSILRYY